MEVDEGWVLGEAIDEKYRNDPVTAVTSMITVATMTSIVDIASCDPLFNRIALL